jgi:hypothetical protein
MKMEATNIVFLGLAPNGQEMYSWFEGDIQYVEYWQPVPGGGMVQTRQS